MRNPARWPRVPGSPGSWPPWRAEIETESSREAGAAPLTFEVWADMRYEGQSFDLPVTAPAGLAPAALVAALVERFEAEHERTYGQRARNERVVVVAVRLIGRVASAGNGIATGVRGRAAAPESRRNAWFGPGLGWVPTPVVGRDSISGTGREGPLLVEEYDSVIVVPPRCSARSGPSGSIVISVDTSDT